MLCAANRDKFLEAAEDPASYSHIQMTTYLKASAFRQQIEKHKKALGGGTQLGPQDAAGVVQVGGGGEGELGKGDGGRGVGAGRGGGWGRGRWLGGCGGRRQGVKVGNLGKGAGVRGGIWVRGRGWEGESG